jgi:leucyl aminopeptidase
VDTCGRASEATADVLIVPTFERDTLADVEGLDTVTGGELSRAAGACEFRGKPYEVFLTPVVHPGWRSRRVMLVGAGPREGFSSSLMRRLASAGTLVARQRRLSSVALILRGPLDVVEAAQAAAEGMVLADFDVASYKTGEPDLAPIATRQIVATDGNPAVARALARGATIATAANLSRELGNEPANVLTPRVFADRASAIAGGVGVDVEVLDERAIAELRMGLLLGVARGSAEPPRVIVLRYAPENSRGGPVLGLVGKGVTFDTGGISIKPADGMERMKDDMAGGAAVVCAIRALAELGAPVRVVGVVPATENMPGGRATRPGDILTSASGTTVEVVNTDAEGRLILGDALWYARRLGATHLVDVATLTGACVVALGKSTSGLFGRPDSWVDAVRRAATRAGDRAWPMPLFDDYRDQLKSEVADIINSGGRPGGAITAAIFLKEFVGDLPWVHMDIAGTAWAEESKPYMPKGPTGVAVGTLTELALSAGAWADAGQSM